MNYQAKHKHERDINAADYRLLRGILLHELYIRRNGAGKERDDFCRMVRIALVRTRYGYYVNHK